MVLNPTEETKVQLRNQFIKGIGKQQNFLNLSLKVARVGAHLT